MIARIWRTKVHPDREVEYEPHAQEQSLPMFRLQAGCLGVLFMETPEERAVLSLWADEGAVAALASSPTYQETARRLTASGVLSGTSTVEVFEIHGGFLKSLDGEDR